MRAQRLMMQFGRLLRISVNLTARRLKLCSIVDQVRLALAGTGLPPHLLELERTESTLIEDIEHTVAVLKGLKRLGLRLGVADFGTGYSGLAYLREFPLDVLKLDRTFLTQKDGTSASFEFIHAFIDLTHVLKMPVAAEAAETGETLQFLCDACCDEA